jgi:hypothetical protein
MTNATAAATEVFSRLDDHVVQANVELFESYGFRIEHQESSRAMLAAADEHIDAGIIGFMGPGFRGALVLAAPAAVVTRWQLAVGCESAEALRHDTVAEFSNMLLGRFKYRLLLEGIELQMATPISVCARSLDLPRPSEGASCWHRFTGSAGRIDVRIDVAFDPDFAGAFEVPGEAPAAAGEAVLF